MFDHLPQHIRETIFSRVRYVDLFETARVSQEWWALSMASFQRVLHARDDFLLDQVGFCNEMMPKEEPWEWWMLMEFTKSKKLYLARKEIGQLIQGDTTKLIQYFEDKEINVHDLRLNGWNQGLPPNLNQIFPHLTSLELTDVQFEDDSAVVLPSKLKVLKLNWITVPSMTSLSSMLSAPNELKVLHLGGAYSGVHFDGNNFQNLTRLSINATCLLSDDDPEVNHILRNILKGNKALMNVSLEFVTITKEWLQMFPSNVVELELNGPYLSQNLIEVFGENVLYERMLLFYIFEDWTSVIDFKSRRMKWDKVWPGDYDYDEYDEANYDEYDEADYNEYHKADYEINYVCKPASNQEEIEVFHIKENTAFNDAISLNNEGLVLNKLTGKGENFPHAVPRTIRHLSFRWIYHSRETLAFEDPSVLETVDLNWKHGSVCTFDDFSKMIHLRKLAICECDSRYLACILVSCTSLTDLRFSSSKVHVFKEIASDVLSVSLKRLTILNGNDTVQDILKHLPSLSMLNLEGHDIMAILQSDIEAISRLQYFKLMTGKNKHVTVHLSKLEFPYILFVRSDRSDFYAASKGMEIINEVSANNYVNAERSFILNSYFSGQKPLSIYSRNVASRFLTNSCIVANTVHDFIAMHESVKGFQC